MSCKDPGSVAGVVPEPEKIIIDPVLPLPLLQVKKKKRVSFAPFMTRSLEKRPWIWHYFLSDADKRARQEGSGPATKRQKVQVRSDDKSLPKASSTMTCSMTKLLERLGPSSSVPMPEAKQVAIVPPRVVAPKPSPSITSPVAVPSAKKLAIEFLGPGDCHFVL